MPTNLPERKRKSPEEWDEERIIPIVLRALLVITAILLLWWYLG
jgi:hypothetical protein